MMMNWSHAGPTVLAASLASLMEFVEALTVVLAVGAVLAWLGAAWPPIILLLGFAAMLVESAMRRAGRLS